MLLPLIHLCENIAIGERDISLHVSIARVGVGHEGHNCKTNYLRGLIAKNLNSEIFNFYISILIVNSCTAVVKQVFKTKLYNHNKKDWVAFVQFWLNVELHLFSPLIKIELHMKILLYYSAQDQIEQILNWAKSKSIGLTSTGLSSMTGNREHAQQMYLS